MSKRSALRAATLIGAAFGAGIAGTSTVNALTAPSPSVKPTDAPAAAVSKAYAVFSQAPVAEESARFSQRADILADQGLNPNLARSGARLAETNDEVLVSPSKDGLCIGTRLTGVSGCSNGATALNGTVGAVICSPTIPANKVLLVGAFPNGVQDVTGILSDGSTASYPIKRNSLILLLDKSKPVPTSLGYVANGAQQNISTSIPKDSLSCGG